MIVWGIEAADFDWAVSIWGIQIRAYRWFDGKNMIVKIIVKSYAFTVEIA